MKWSSHSSTMAQTLYAQLQQTVLNSSILNSVAGLSGNFSKRAVKGKTYWYYRYSNPGQGERQIFLGPDSPELNELISKNDAPEVAATKGHLRRLVRACAAAGCQATIGPHFKLIRQLSQHGFFHAGGLLVGSHAFSAYANLLGVTWSSEESFRTMDVDFSHSGRNISVALPGNIQVDITSAIESLEEGFLPRISSRGRSGSWFHPVDLDYEIDFLTPQTGSSSDPFEFEPLGIALQPLRFMEYSMVNVQQTVMFDNNEAIVVNVPDPARYALHKLIVFTERQNRVKAQKDLIQSAALIEIIKRDQPYSLVEAWDDLQQRGPGWRRRFGVGLDALEAQFSQESLSHWVESVRSDMDSGPSLPAWRQT